MTASLDLQCFSIRDFLGLVVAARQQAPRDPMGALTDSLLDLSNREVES